jgi:hypothetical protein
MLGSAAIAGLGLRTQLDRLAAYTTSGTKGK